MNYWSMITQMFARLWRNTRPPRARPHWGQCSAHHSSPGSPRISPSMSPVWWISPPGDPGVRTAGGSCSPRPRHCQADRQFAELDTGPSSAPGPALRNAPALPCKPTAGLNILPDKKAYFNYLVNLVFSAQNFPNLSISLKNIQTCLQKLICFTKVEKKRF